MKYKRFKNIKNEYDIYNVYGKYIVTCKSSKVADDVINLLNSDSKVSNDDVDILERMNELNNIEEHRPANDNSILNSRIARTTRELLGKDR